MPSSDNNLTSKQDLEGFHIKDTHIESLFSEQMEQANVMVIGDIILDKYVFGTADRLSPESPVPVLNVNRETYRLGGAANVVSNLAGLGVKSYLAGLVGADEDADIVRKMLSSLIVNEKGLITDQNRPTIKKTRFLANHMQLLRTDQEVTTPIAIQHAEKILEHVHAHITEVDVIILSDYGKGVFNKNFAADIIKLARKNNVAVIVDPKGKDYRRYSGSTIITPNLKELSDGLDVSPPRTDKEVIAAAETLAADIDVDAVLVTRSQDGMSLVPKQKNSYGLNHSYHFKAKVVDVYDVSGAGDTVIATLGACMACSVILPEAIQIANTAAGLVVQKVGTAAVQARELKSALNSDGGPLRQRIYAPDNWPGALQVVEQWKSQGLTVGFTNGCFDILHAGHVAYLNETRHKCDRLVLGLNVDESVKRLKGEDRPVNTQGNRAAVLAALKAVDLVVLFAQSPEEEDKAIKIIQLLKPDMYFKGGDYEQDDIPEAPYVRDYGGDVFVCKPVEGISTTITIEKLQKGKKVA